MLKVFDTLEIHVLVGGGATFATTGAVNDGIGRSDCLLQLIYGSSIAEVAGVAMIMAAERAARNLPPLRQRTISDFGTKISITCDQQLHWQIIACSEEIANGSSVIYCSMCKKNCPEFL